MDAFQLDEDVESVLDATVQDAQEVEDMLLQELEHRNQLLLRARGVITSLQADYETLYQEAGAATFRDARPPPREDVAVLTDDISSTLYESEFGLGIFQGEPTSPAGFDRSGGVVGAGARAHTRHDAASSSQHSQQQAWGGSAALPATGVVPSRGLVPLKVPKALVISGANNSSSSPISPQHRRAVLGAGGVVLQKSQSLPLQPLVLPKGGGVPPGPRSPHLKADVVGSLRPSPLGVLSPTSQDSRGGDVGMGYAPAPGEGDVEHERDAGALVRDGAVREGLAVSRAGLSTAALRGPSDSRAGQGAEEHAGGATHLENVSVGGMASAGRGMPPAESLVGSSQGPAAMAQSGRVGALGTGGAGAGSTRAADGSSQGDGSKEGVARGGDQAPALPGDSARKMAGTGAQGVGPVPAGRLKAVGPAARHAAHDPAMLATVGYAVDEHVAVPPANAATSALVVNAAEASGPISAVAGGRTHWAGSGDDGFPLERLHDWLEAGARGDAEAGALYLGMEEEDRARGGVARGLAAMRASGVLATRDDAGILKAHAGSPLRLDPSGDALPGWAGNEGTWALPQGVPARAQEAAMLLPSQLPRPRPAPGRAGVGGEMAVGEEQAATRGVPSGVVGGSGDSSRDDGPGSTGHEAAAIAAVGDDRQVPATTGKRTNATASSNPDASVPWQDSVVFPSMDLPARQVEGAASGQGHAPLSSHMPSRIPLPAAHVRGPAEAHAIESTAGQGRPLAAAAATNKVPHSLLDDAGGKDEGHDAVRVRGAAPAGEPTELGLAREYGGQRPGSGPMDALGNGALRTMPTSAELGQQSAHAGAGEATQQVAPPGAAGGRPPSATGIGSLLLAGGSGQTSNKNMGGGHLVAPHPVQKGWSPAVQAVDSEGERVRAEGHAGLATVAHESRAAPSSAPVPPGEPTGRAHMRGEGNEPYGDARKTIDTGSFLTNGRLQPPRAVPKGKVLSIAQAEFAGSGGPSIQGEGMPTSPPDLAGGGLDTGPNAMLGQHRVDVGGVGTGGPVARAGGSRGGDGALGMDSSAGNRRDTTEALLPSRLPLPGSSKQRAPHVADGARTEWDDAFATEASNLFAELGAAPRASMSQRTGILAPQGAAASWVAGGGEGSDRFDLDAQADWGISGEDPGSVARPPLPEVVDVPAAHEAATRAASAPKGRPPTGQEAHSRQGPVQQRQRSLPDVAAGSHEGLLPQQGQVADSRKAQNTNHRALRGDSGGSRSSSSSGGGSKDRAPVPRDRLSADARNNGVTSASCLPAADPLTATLPPPQLPVPAARTDALTQQLLQFKAKYMGGSARHAQPQRGAASSIPTSARLSAGTDVARGRDDLLFSASKEDVPPWPAELAPAHARGLGEQLRHGYVAGGRTSGSMHRSHSSQGLSDSPGTGSSRDRDAGRQGGLRKSSSFGERGAKVEGAPLSFVHPGWQEQGPPGGMRGEQAWPDGSTALDGVRDSREATLAADTWRLGGDARADEWGLASSDAREHPSGQPTSVRAPTRSDGAGNVAVGSRHRPFSAPVRHETDPRMVTSTGAHSRHDRGDRGHRGDARQGHGTGTGRAREGKGGASSSSQMPEWERELLEQITSFRRSMSQRSPAHARSKGEPVSAALRGGEPREQEARGGRAIRTRSRDRLDREVEPPLFADGSGAHGDAAAHAHVRGQAGTRTGAPLDGARLHGNGWHYATGNGAGATALSVDKVDAAARPAPMGDASYTRSSWHGEQAAREDVLQQQAARRTSCGAPGVGPGVTFTSTMGSAPHAAPAVPLPDPALSPSPAGAATRVPVAASWDSRLERTEAWRGREEERELVADVDGGQHPRRAGCGVDTAPGAAHAHGDEAPSMSSERQRAPRAGRDARGHRSALGGDAWEDGGGGEQAHFSGAKGKLTTRQRSRSRSSSRSRGKHKSGGARLFLSPELVLQHTVQRAWGRLGKGRHHQGDGAYVSPSSSSSPSASEDEGQPLQRMVVAGGRARDARKRLMLASGWLLDKTVFDSASMSGQMGGDVVQPWDAAAAPGVASAASFFPTGSLPLTATAAGPGWCIHVARDESCHVDLRSAGGVAVVSVVHPGSGEPIQSSLNAEAGLPGSRFDAGAQALAQQSVHASADVAVDAGNAVEGTLGEAIAGASTRVSVAGPLSDASASMGAAPGTDVGRPQQGDGMATVGVTEAGGKVPPVEHARELTEQLARLERQLSTLVEKHASRLPQLVRSAAGDVSSSDEMPPMEDVGRWAAPPPLARGVHYVSEEVGDSLAGVASRDGMPLSASGGHNQAGMSIKAEDSIFMDDTQAENCRDFLGWMGPRVRSQGSAGVLPNSAWHKHFDDDAQKQDSGAGMRGRSLVRVAPGPDALELATQMLDRDLNELKAECSSTGMSSYLSTPRLPSQHGISPASLPFFSASRPL